MLIINFLAFQVCWVAAVWGAGNGMGWLGPIAVSLFAGWELSQSRSRSRDLQLLLTVALLGLAIDSGYLVAGLIQFESPGPSATLAPLWIVTMWISFALTLNGSLRWLAGRPLLAAVFGLVGAPLTYWVAVEVWGAASFTAPLPLALAAIGIAWAVATPVLVALAGAPSTASSGVLRETPA